MKKIITAMLVAASLTMHAQNKDFYIGGSLGAWYEKQPLESSITKTTSIQILPEFGRWLSSKVALGFSVGFEYLRESNKSKYLGYESFDFESEQTVALVYPYFRYKIWGKSVVSFFVDAGGGFGLLSNKAEDENKAAWEVGLQPGILIKMSDKVDLIGRMGFLGLKGEDNTVEGGGLQFDATNIKVGVIVNY